MATTLAGSGFAISNGSRNGPCACMTRLVARPSLELPTDITAQGCRQSEIRGCRANKQMWECGVYQNAPYLRLPRWGDCWSGSVKPCAGSWQLAQACPAGEDRLVSKNSFCPKASVRARVESVDRVVLLLSPQAVQSDGEQKAVGKGTDFHGVIRWLVAVDQWLLLFNQLSLSRLWC